MQHFGVSKHFANVQFLIKTCQINSLNFRAKVQNYLRTLPIMTLVKSLKFNAISFVFTIDGTLDFMVIAIESRGDVLAKPVLAEKQVLQLSTDIVILAVLELAHGETTVKLEIAFKGLRRVATITIRTTFA